MFKYITIITLVSTIYGCSPKNKAPCNYETVPVEMTVESIKPYTENDKKYFHVGLKFYMSSLRNETQYLEKLRNVKIDSTYLKRNKIIEGVIYQGTVSDIISGDCDPFFISYQYNFKD